MHWFIWFHEFVTGMCFLRLDYPDNWNLFVISWSHPQQYLFAFQNSNFCYTWFTKSSSFAKLLIFIALYLVCLKFHTLVVYFSLSESQSSQRYYLVSRLFVWGILCRHQENLIMTFQFPFHMVAGCWYKLLIFHCSS